MCSSDLFSVSFPSFHLMNRIGTQCCPRFCFYLQRIATAKNVWEVKKEKNNASYTPAPSPRMASSTWRDRVSRSRRSAASRIRMRTAPSPPRRYRRPCRRNRTGMPEIELAAHFFTASGRRVLHSCRRRRTSCAFTDPSTSCRVSLRFEQSLFLAPYCSVMLHHREPPSSAVLLVASANSGDHPAPRHRRSTQDSAALPIRET